MIALKSKPEQCPYDWCYSALSQGSIIITFFLNLAVKLNRIRKCYLCFKEQ